jgi:hypothetical protein
MKIDRWHLCSETDCDRDDFRVYLFSGARAIPGSQRELAQRAGRIGSDIIFHTFVLRAGDGSRSAPNTYFRSR